MTAASLLSCPEPLAARYDVALLDLDGVVYIGPDAVPGAPRALERARGAGMRLAFVTNNAARAPAAVADHLRSLGVPVETSEVVTSAQAAAHHLAERLPPHSRVLVVGTTGLLEALTERGLVPVSSADDDPAALVHGLLARSRLAHARRGCRGDPARCALGCDQLGRDGAFNARTTAGQRLHGRRAATRHGTNAGLGRKARSGDASRGGRALWRKASPRDR